MRTTRASDAKMMEPLESRAYLSNPIDYTFEYAGPLKEGAHTVATVDLTISDQRGHGIVDGILKVRFAKHDAMTWTFTTEIVKHRLSVGIATSDGGQFSNFTFEGDFVIAPHPSNVIVEGEQQPLIGISMLGSGQFEGQSGKFVGEIPFLPVY